MLLDCVEGTFAHAFAHRLVAAQTPAGSAGRARSTSRPSPSGAARHPSPPAAAAASRGTYPPASTLRTRAPNTLACCESSGPSFVPPTKPSKILARDLARMIQLDLVNVNLDIMI